MGNRVASQSDFDAINRRSRTRPTSSGKRVTPHERELLWFRRILEHGPLSSSYLHDFSKHLRRSKKRAQERLTDLFHEEHTPHGAPYLTRPHQQFRTIDSRYNELVYDLTPAAVAALKEAKLWSQYCSSHAGPWLHRYMVSCITASIELATLERDDISFIAGSAILARAKAALRFSTTIQDPHTGRTLTKDLMPDAVFGLEYKQHQHRSFRFFVVEADRGTEPATTTNFNRKSHLRTVLQYRDYIGNGRYQQHLNLTAPLLVLNVFSEEAKRWRVQKLAAELAGSGGNAYLLFQTFPEFADAFRPPPPNRALLNRAWPRAGKPSLNISKAV